MAGAPFFFGASAIIASVVIMSPAMEAASSSATRTTLAGSTMPCSACRHIARSERRSRRSATCSRESCRYSLASSSRIFAMFFRLSGNAEAYLELLADLTRRAPGEGADREERPSVPVSLIELSSQVILHKFNSPTIACSCIKCSILFSAKKEMVDRSAAAFSGLDGSGTLAPLRTCSRSVGRPPQRLCRWRGDCGLMPLPCANVGSYVGSISDL
jgi:hypothetical protein